MTDNNSGGDAGPDTRPSRETSVATIDQREAAMSEREAAVGARENAMLAKEEITALKEEAVRLQTEVTRVHDKLALVQEGVTRLNLTMANQEGDDLERLLSPLREANEHLVVATIRAQTLREAAEQTNRRQEEFLATLAHELRNPLAPIRSAAAILSLVAAGQPKVQYVHDVIARQVEHMARLLDDLLDVSRVTHGKVSLQRRPVSVSEFVGLAVESCRPFLESRSQHFQLDIPTLPLYVDGDPVRLAQVFSNLLNNAGKYTQPGGAIALSAELKGDAVLLCVKDNGSGISAEALPRIFELFAQEERAGDKRVGLGIGLTVVRHMVEMHGGTVDVRSAGVNLGSEFLVTLPLLGKGSAVSAIGGTPEVSLSGPRYRIVLIDDNVDANKALQLLLQLMGHEVSIAFDGATGLELTQSVRPHIVLCDIGLPDMDGYAVIKRLREELKGAAPVLIAVTGYGQEKDRSRSLEAGFDDHLIKPVDPAVLLHLIATHEERLAKT